MPRNPPAPCGDHRTKEARMKKWAAGKNEVVRRFHRVWEKRRGRKGAKTQRFIRINMTIFLKQAMYHHQTTDANNYCPIIIKGEFGYGA